MPLYARCSHCDHNFMYPAVGAGRMGVCPKCRKQTLQGPPPAAAPAPAAGGATYAAPGAPSAVTPPPAETLQPGVTLGGRYVLDTELGRGAFGVVYRAFDTRLERKPVAIKVLLEKALATPDAVKRFRAEARLLCHVHHAHIPAVLDIGEFAGQQYIVFAFVNGKTVRELIPPTGFDDPAAAARLVAKLARTLHDIYAGQSILHRDVKPANMMVPAGQADGLYLMDFGLAVCHDTDAERTQEGTTLGTPWYMSPEQATGHIAGIGHQSDIYSAGAVLYHLLTGRTPFTSKWPGIMADILATPPDPPSYHRPDLDPELDAIVLKALNKRAEDRFATGAEMAEQLELWAARALVGTSGSRPAYAPRRPAYPSSGPSSGSVRQAPRSASEQSSVVGGETVDNPSSGSRSRTQGPAPGTVIMVKALPPDNPRGPLVKILAGVAVLLVVAIGAFVLTRPSGKVDPTPPAKTNPEGGMKEWKRG